MVKSNELIAELVKIFPSAHCELNYRNSFELLIAVVLSAQTTDRRVNIVTKDLFAAYPDVYHLAKANKNDVQKLISSLGLFRTKTDKIIAISQKLVASFDGQVPNNLEELLTLPGVGRKSANVILSEAFGIPAIAVDTHVFRVANRLGIAKSEDVYEVEKSLENYFPQANWHQAHNLLVHFGRYFCTSKNPKCLDCPFKNNCRYYQKN